MKKIRLNSCVSDGFLLAFSNFPVAFHKKENCAKKSIYIAGILRYNI